mmetsp:Transcript_10854/g.21599  ORF Transcript_10854/g.21599 Transcript_10854/m.21599 type:complete len:260 (+) Transcript_10854:13-792(+)
MNSQLLLHQVGNHKCSAKKTSVLKNHETITTLMSYLLQSENTQKVNPQQGSKECVARSDSKGQGCADSRVVLEQNFNTSLLDNTSQNLIPQVRTRCHVQPICPRHDCHILRRIQWDKGWIQHFANCNKAVRHTNPQKTCKEANTKQFSSISHDRAAALDERERLVSRWNLLECIVWTACKDVGKHTWSLGCHAFIRCVRWSRQPHQHKIGNQCHANIGENKVQLAFKLLPTLGILCGSLCANSNAYLYGNFHQKSWICQ